MALRTYEAVLKGDRLAWAGDAPDAEQEMRVHVTVLDAAPAPEIDRASGRAMADALRKAAVAGAYRDIEDPVAWQREIRKDRPMPGRDE